MLFLPSVAPCPELSQCSGQAGSSPGRCDWERGVHIVKFTVTELLIRVNSHSCGHCVSLTVESVCHSQIPPTACWKVEKSLDKVSMELQKVNHV